MKGSFVKNDVYRMASWWLSWEDLLFPDPGIEGKMVQRAKKFKAAGVDMVVIFGCHFRWDYIYNWDQFHHLLKFIVDTCHKEGIKVFDHHSASLTHRVDTLDEYRNINEKNRHHVPFFPSREFADTITYDGHKLNDFRMVSVQDGKPCYLDTYNAETFCMNNTDFVQAYSRYVGQLLHTGIDGLMCDDIIYYPSWDGCGCDFCRKKFKDQYGHDLPPSHDETFWGNYESSAFKDWIHMRYHDSFDFLNAVKETVGADFPLMSCCSSSSVKALDGSGMSAEIMVRGMNHVMLEICGEIVSDKFDYSERISDFMLHKAIARKHGHPSIGLGYAHNPDSAFVIWAFNKIFGSSAWISTLTGRFGLSEEVRKTIPDEADIIQEAYAFEQQHENLFRGESSAKLAVLFSLDNLMYNGCAQSDYSQPWHDITTGLFMRNVQFDVVLDVPSADNHPLLLLSNCDCVSSELMAQLRDYREQGGVVIATGLLGFRNERGEGLAKPFLADLDVTLRDGTFNRKIPTADLFDPKRRVPKESISGYDVYHGEERISQDQWIGLDGLHWLPKASTASAISRVQELLPANDIEVSCPEGWIYRILRDDDTSTYFVHLLALDIGAVPYKTFRNNLLDQPVVESLNFRPGSGLLEIASSLGRATLHSPDLPDSVDMEPVEGGHAVELGNLKRYLIVELF